MTRTRLLASTILLVGLAAGLSGCQLYVEHVCGDHEYPAYALDNPTGRYCVRDGRTPRPGFAAFPPGRVPRVVGDKYDRWPLAKDYPWADEVDPALRRRDG